ncbi:FHA domain-containing protein [Antarctobacter jejuensis]|uniref:FHA domain-containing protein n=1 Tax=Antarctobacter jejuensis TaxID=1439938 RepID=UPI003FD57D90
MRGFKDLIARRRPTTEGGTEQPPEGDPLVDPWEDLQRSASRPGSSPRFDEETQAREARDHVPRPPRPKPMMSRKWTPQDAHLAEAARKAAQETPREEEAVAEALRDPSPSRRPPQTRMILADLETIREDLPAAGPAPQREPSQPAAPAAAAPMPSRPKVWDIDPVETPAPPRAPSAPVSALAQSAASAYGTEPSAAPRPASTRAKTRLLGFHSDAEPDVMDTAPAAAASEAPRFPIGWLVVIDGPGRGASFTLTAGLSTIGRDVDQTVTLDFGDAAISRERHVAIAHDEDENRTYVGHGGKANIVKLNDKPLLTTEELKDQDCIRIGKTRLRFVAFCSAEFSWTTGHEASDG